MQSMAAAATASSSRAWAATRRSSASPSLPSHRITFSSSSSSCRWPVASVGTPELPLGIRGVLRPLPSAGDGRGGAGARMRTAATVAASPAAEGDGKPEGAGISRTLQLGAMILVWYLLNICFIIYNKLILKAVPFPYTITTFQFASGSFFITLMWLLNLHPKPRLSLQQTPSILVLGSLAPIVGGVVLASMTEVSFNWIDFGVPWLPILQINHGMFLARNFWLIKSHGIFVICPANAICRRHQVYSILPTEHWS